MHVHPMSIPTEGTPSSTQTTLAQSKIINGLRPDPTLTMSTWIHQAWLASGCTTVLFALAKSIVVSITSHIWVKPILAALVGYVVADLMSGVYHWGIDNYGDATTPIFGAQIEAFKGHHRQPWFITKRQLANNLHALGQAVTFTFLPIILNCKDPTLMAFFGSLSGCLLFSQQFHAWSHATKSKLPPIVVALQDVGVLLSRSQHAAHHRPPYNSNYCIVSGIWNKFLDEYKVFTALEMALHFQFGVRPRSWDDTSLEWTDESSLPSNLALLAQS